jgi:hypothetical protein
MPHPHPAGRRPPLAAILLVPLVVAVVLTLFAWPAARMQPRDMPIGVAGTGPAAAAIEHHLGGRAGAFELHRYRDEAAARRAIEDRAVYGAFVASATAPKVLTASGASPMVAQMLAAAATEAGPDGAAPPPVEDVAPAAERGAALPSAVLPLVIAGLLTGLLASHLASGAARRTALVVAGSALAGIVAAAVVQSWLDVIDGDWLRNAGVLSLTVLAIASAVIGLRALAGAAGAVAAVVTMVLVGNPFSAAASAPELLPEPAGALGHLLPPGAGAALLRSTTAFDGAGGTRPLLVLAAWALGGLALLAAATLRRRRASAVPAPAAA